MPEESSQVYTSEDEATRITCPCRATGEGITTTGADRAVVTACDKGATGRKNVLEWSAVYADLQYATVKPVVQSIIIRETQKRTSEPVV
jgi:hypothetical protein